MLARCVNLDSLISFARGSCQVQYTPLVPDERGRAVKGVEVKHWFHVFTEEVVSATGVSGVTVFRSQMPTKPPPPATDIVRERFPAAFAKGEAAVALLSRPAAPSSQQNGDASPTAMDTSPLRETPAKQQPSQLQQQPLAAKLSAAEFAAAVAGGAAASGPGNGTSGGGGGRSEDADEPMEQWKAGKAATTGPEDLSVFEDDKNSTHLLEMSSTQSVLTSVCCVSERTPVSVQPPR